MSTQQIVSRSDRVIAAIELEKIANEHDKFDDPLAARLRRVAAELEEN